MEHCGHVISSTGPHQEDQKVQAITQMPRPQDGTKLTSILGMVQYYAKFLPNLASQLESLRQLLQKDTKWTWKREQENCFKTVKNLLLQDRVLTHFDPDLPVILSCDSSSYELGALLYHRMPSCSERPLPTHQGPLARQRGSIHKLNERRLPYIEEYGNSRCI